MMPHLITNGWPILKKVIYRADSLSRENMKKLSMLLKLIRKKERIYKSIIIFILMKSSMNFTIMDKKPLKTRKDKR